jgi:hypothetical protein
MLCRSLITAAAASPLLPAPTVTAPTVKVGKIETDILGVDCTNIWNWKVHTPLVPTNTHGSHVTCARLGSNRAQPRIPPVVLQRIWEPIMRLRWVLGLLSWLKGGKRIVHDARWLGTYDKNAIRAFP